MKRSKSLKSRFKSRRLKKNNKKRRSMKGNRKQRGGFNCVNKIEDWPIEGKTGMEGTVYLIDINTVQKRMFKYSHGEIEKFLKNISELQRVAGENNLAPQVLRTNIKRCNIVHRDYNLNKAPCIKKVDSRSTRASVASPMYLYESRDNECRDNDIPEESVCSVNDFLFEKLKKDITSSVKNDLYIVDLVMNRLGGITLDELWDYLTQKIMLFTQDPTEINKLLTKVQNTWKDQIEILTQKLLEYGIRTTDMHYGNIMIDINNAGLCDFIKNIKIESAADLKKFEFSEFAEAILNHPDFEGYGADDENFLKFIDFGALVG